MFLAEESMCWGYVGGVCVRKSSMDTSATSLSPVIGRKGCFHVFWGVISFNKYSTNGEDPDECLNHDLGLLHDFTGLSRPKF